MLSGSRIRPGLFRYILEADLAEKKTDHLGAIEFYESIARQHDRWLYDRIMSEPRTGQQWSMAPLGYRVSAVARDRLLLVGDAAGYLSPITGQGNEFAMRTGRLAALAADRALRSGDLRADAFSLYIEGRKQEVERQVDYVRAQLRILRDPQALMRAARDDDYRAQVFGPYGIPATARGSLIS
jgi:flavin-dependent dehydrogenase